MQLGTFQVYKSKELCFKPKRVSKIEPLSKTGNANQSLKQKQIPRQNKPKNVQPLKSTANGLECADYNLALQRKKRQSNRYYKGQLVEVTISKQHFKIYGPGVYLFFCFLWKLSILFLLLSLVSLVPMTYNYLYGNRFNNSVQSLGVYIGRVSISNFYGNNPRKTTVQLIEYTKMNKLVNAVCDLLCCLMILIFYFYWTKQSENLNENIQKTFKLPNYYTLELTKFPLDVDQIEIYNFFSKFGEVTQIAPVKNFEGTIQLSKEIYQLQTKIKQLKLQDFEDNSTNNQKQIQQIYKNLTKLYNDLMSQEKKSKQEIIMYYVTFLTPLQRSHTLKRFKKIYDVWCPGCKNIPKDYLLKGCRVTVEACHDQPGEIIWENVHITWKTRWIRALIQFFLLLLIVFIGFFTISALDVITPPSILESIDTSLHNSQSILQQKNQTVVQSWCLKNTQIATSTSKLQSICSSYINRYYINLVITYAITVFVIIIKAFLKKLVIFIAKFQRYKQHTEQSIDIMKNLVIIYIITTVVIGFLLQAHFFGIRFKYIIPDLLNNETLKKNASLLEDYSALQNNWYLDIGYQIWLTWAILAISPHSYMPLYHYFMQWLTQRLARGQKLQKNMDKALKPAEFEIEDHYANIIMILVVGLAFSGGMPCIIIVSFIGIITRYCYLKFLFIRFSRVPKQFDEHLNSAVLSYFPWTLLIHFLMTIWMFNVPSIFAFEESYFSGWYLETKSSVIHLISKFLEMLVASYYYTIIALIILLLVVVKEVIYDFLVTVCKKDDDHFDQKRHQDSASNLNMPHIVSHRGITNSYKIQNNPDYFQILAIKEKMKIQNNEVENNNFK